MSKLLKITNMVNDFGDELEFNNEYVGETYNSLEELQNEIIELYTSYYSDRYVDYVECEDFDEDEKEYYEELQNRDGDLRISFGKTLWITFNLKTNEIYIEHPDVHNFNDTWNFEYIDKSIETLIKNNTEEELKKLDQFKNIDIIR